MPQPTASDLHIDALLTNLSVNIMNDPNKYIFNKIFPIVVVNKQSDKIAKYNEEFFLKDEAAIRAPGDESAGGGFKVDTSDTYFCDNYAFHYDIPDEVRENADLPFDVDIDGTVYVMDKLLMRQEIQFVADFFTTGVWTGDSTPSNLWSDYALSDPIGDIETGKATIHAATGRMPGDFTVGMSVWSKLKHHPDFIERIKYTQRGVLTREIVASILELSNLYVGETIKVTALENNSTQTKSYIWGKHGLLSFSPGSPALRTPSCGYTFMWKRYGMKSFMRRLRNDFKQFDRLEGHVYFDQKKITQACGYFFNGAVA